jgi:hypothetical protein
MPLDHHEQEKDRAEKEAKRLKRQWEDGQRDGDHILPVGQDFDADIRDLIKREEE